VIRNNIPKAKLKQGQIVIGSGVTQLRSTHVPRLFALAGFDFIFIDMEHSAFTMETVAEMILTARSVDIAPIVRVPNAEYTFVARVLDLGAQGVIVPRVNTPQQVEEIVSWVKYPPHGVRGATMTYAQTEGQTIPPEQFIDQIVDQTLLVIQIERKQALENLDEMLSISGVDVAALGYLDLSVDLGIAGQIDHPRMVESIESIIAACDRHGISAGLIHPNMKVITHWAGRGMRFLSYSTGANLLLEAATDAVRQLRTNDNKGST